MNWYVKGTDGKVFGPADDERIVAWVKDGRVDPFAGISNDLNQWKLASLEPMLEMDWIVENEPGRFYGPTHRAVVDDLIKNGSLSPTCRIYRDFHDGAAEKAEAAARDAAEKAMAEVQAEAEKAMAELKNEAEQAIASKNSEIAELKSEMEEARRKAAIAIAKEMNLKYRESLTGTVQEVLFEEMDGKYFTGHTPNYVKVYCVGEELHNRVRKVKITGVYKDGCLAE